MTTRITKEVLFLRHEFSKDERLEMGSNLANAYNRLASIEDEEAVMKAQVKDRKAGVEQTIGSLSRNLANGFDMVNIECETVWDTPNIGEVSYRRKDNGEIAKVRAMTSEERQMDLPLDGTVVVVPPEQSAENIKGFFKPNDEPTPEEVEQAEEDKEVGFSDNPEDDEHLELDPDNQEDGPIQTGKPADDDASLFEDAREILERHGKVSASVLQKELVIGYSSAAHLIDALVEHGIVSEPDENGIRTLIPKAGNGHTKSGPHELKALHEEIVAAESAPAEAPKRGRGRPPKNPKVPQGFENPLYRPEQEF